MILKKMLQLKLTIGIVFCGYLAQAQRPNFTPIVNNQVQSNPYIFPENGYTINQRHGFKVYFKDSSIKRVFGELKTDSLSEYLLWEDKTLKEKDSARVKKIFPAQTVCIVRDDSGLPPFKGTSFDSCWLFKVIEGKITAYSTIADEEVPIDYVQYIQKDNNQVLKMTPDNLELILMDNDEALKLFKKKKYLKAIIKYNRMNK